MKPVHHSCLRICILTVFFLGARGHAEFIVDSGDWQDTANWSEVVVDGTVNNNGTAIFDPDTYKTGAVATMPEGGAIKIGGMADDSGTSALEIRSGTFGNSAITLGSDIGNLQAKFVVSGGTVVFGDATLAAGGANVTWTQTGGSTTMGAGAGRTTLASGGTNVMTFSGDAQFTINTTGEYGGDIVNFAGSDLTMNFSGTSSFTATGPAATGIATDRQGGKSLWHFDGSGVSTSVEHRWMAHAGTTFQFTADSGGVSPVNITTTGEDWNQLDLIESPSLQVDVTDYKPSGEMVLFTYPKRNGAFGTVKVTHGDRTLVPFEEEFATRGSLSEGEYYLEYGESDIMLHYNAGAAKGAGKKMP